MLCVCQAVSEEAALLVEELAKLRARDSGEGTHTPAYVAVLPSSPPLATWHGLLTPPPLVPRGRYVAVLKMLAGLRPLLSGEIQSEVDEAMALAGRAQEDAPGKRMMQRTGSRMSGAI